MTKVFLLSLILLNSFCFAQTDTLSINLENLDYDYPVKLMNTRIQGQDLRMAYMDMKPAKANGKTVVLFHGKNFAGYYWTQVINGLSNAGYRVIVPDQIGFGKSSKPVIHYSFHELAAQNKNLFDTLKIEKVILLGHSMGGMLATRFALLYPERTEKLILENPIGLEDYRNFVPYVNAEKQYQSERDKSAASIKAYYENSYFPKWKPEYDYLVTAGAGVINSSDYPRYAMVSALTSVMIYEQPIVHEFPLLKVPTTLLIGTADRPLLARTC